MFFILQSPICLHHHDRHYSECKIHLLLLEPLSSCPSAASKGLIKRFCLAYYLVIPFVVRLASIPVFYLSYRLFSEYLCYRVCVSGRISFIVFFICTVLGK